MFRLLNEHTMLKPQYLNWNSIEDPASIEPFHFFFFFTSLHASSHVTELMRLQQRLCVGVHVYSVAVLMRDWGVSGAGALREKVSDRAHE